MLMSTFHGTIEKLKQIPGYIIIRKCRQNTSGKMQLMSAMNL